jgi:hypothetical protein
MMTGIFEDSRHRDLQAVRKARAKVESRKLFTLSSTHWAPHPSFRFNKFASNYRMPGRVATFFPREVDPTLEKAESNLKGQGSVNGFLDVEPRGGNEAGVTLHQGAE